MIGLRLKELPTWLLSLLVVLALHGAAGFWALFWRAPIAPVSMAAAPQAFMIELEPAPIPAPAPPPPPAPIKPPEPKPEPKIVEAPKPKLAIYKPKPKPVSKPQPPKPPVNTEPAPIAATQPNAAPAAAKPAPAAPAAPSQAVPQWQNRLFAHLSKHKRYPDAAKRRERSGVRVCKLRFVMDGRGQLLNYELVGRSGNSLLDRATLEMIRRAQPLPVPPSEMLTNGSLEVVVPIVYELKRS